LVLKTRASLEQKKKEKVASIIRKIERTFSNPIYILSLLKRIQNLYDEGKNNINERINLKWTLMIEILEITSKAIHSRSKRKI
jgi:hypothetical protein